MNILFIQTGGTVDKDYPSGKYGYAFEIADPASERVLKRVKPEFKFEIARLLKKDSLDLTEADRKVIFDTCKKNKADKVVITHGTDTMITTAKALSTLKGKTIVITGALRPEKFSDSDASFNLGMAVAAAQCMKPGVYIAMSGRVYPWNKCEKAKSGQFVEKN